MDSFIELYRANNVLEANAIKGALEHQGLMVRLLGEALGGGAGELPMETQEVRLLVERCALPRAQELLAHYQQSLVPWQCADCGEQNDGHFETCWRCGAVPES
ncbi:putative signal transducing protein [Ferrimonas gelatinilytica]|uniref:RanBP2-type domain-containing protein n=1 Tax=Ferrimonas gelatinilytica TaxID=1255257 RepID=A0ABP9S6K6_9GAMM